jgi:hypothetical protein
MERHFSEITQIAFRGLTEEQRERVERALSTAMLYGILERLSGNSSFIGPATRIEPMYAERLRQLRKLDDGSTQTGDDSSEGEGLPSEN